ncbi:hypothetical protein [Sulfurisphaera javensis]
MKIEEKVELLYNAYKDKKEIEPFEVNSEEATQIFNLFTQKLVKDEGLGGYKISLVTLETIKKFKANGPDYGILTNNMIVKKGNEVKLPFRYSYAEIEVIVLADNCKEDNIPHCIKETYLGIEMPMTRFNAPLNKLNFNQLKADDMVAGLLYLGEKVSEQPKSVEVYINDELKGKDKPNFIYGNYLEMLKWLIKSIGKEVSGYVSTGSIVGPIPINKGEKIRVKSDNAEFEVKLY